MTYAEYIDHIIESHGGLEQHTNIPRGLKGVMTELFIMTDGTAMVVTHEHGYESVNFEHRGLTFETVVPIHKVHILVENAQMKTFYTKEGGGDKQ